MSDHSRWLRRLARGDRVQVRWPASGGVSVYEVWDVRPGVVVSGGMEWETETGTPLRTGQAPLRIEPVEDEG